MIARVIQVCKYKYLDVVCAFWSRCSFWYFPLFRFSKNPPLWRPITSPIGFIPIFPVLSTCSSQCLQKFVSVTCECDRSVFKHYWVRISVGYKHTYYIIFIFWSIGFKNNYKHLKVKGGLPAFCTNWICILRQMEKVEPLKNICTKHRRKWNREAVPGADYNLWRLIWRNLCKLEYPVEKNAKEQIV